jgi:hypothetical protein
MKQAPMPRVPPPLEVGFEIFHHGRLDPGVLLLPKPYRRSDLARMVRLALDQQV